MDFDRDFEAVADELYSLPPDEFTPTRNARVKEARSAKDRDLATAVGALRKPSAGAWVVNLLVRERPDLVDQLSGLADALRSAQETLSGPELRELSTQRHRVVASIVGEARALAGRAGVRVTDTVTRELEATFDAALTDPEAAAAVRSGRLTATLSYAGLGTLAAAPSGEAPRPAPAPAPAETKKPKPKDDAAERRRAEAEAERAAEARRAAEQALQEAERDAERAEDDREAAAAEADQAELDRDDAQERVADLTEQLERAQADAVAAANRVREQHRARSRAEQGAEQAQRRLERARRALDQLA